MKCAREKCNHEFEFYSGKKYCSRLCKQRDSVKRNNIQQKKYYIKKAKLMKTCECGEPYSTYMNKKIMCDKCKRVAGDAKRYALKKPVKQCKICSTVVPYHRSTYCSQVCSDIGTAKKPKIIECKICSKPFRRLQSELHCSKACKTATDRARSKARRDRIVATRTELIDPLVVFTKYNWHCAMCSKPTPKELIGSFNNDSPTIDHVIPLSLGGTHTYDNLQLLCQYCNCSIKRNNIQSTKKLLPCINITLRNYVVVR
jgi:hypothetical protein